MSGPYETPAVCCTETQQYITLGGYEVRKYIALMTDFNETIQNLWFGYIDYWLYCRIRAVREHLKALDGESTCN